MYSDFQKKISEKYNFKAGQRFLLAISGGIDSMVLLNLMQKTGFSIEAAHCNFKLRAEESDADEDFVRDYCQKNHVPIFRKSFETEKFASENKLSIQLAARKLRYDWFFELKNKYHFDFIVTAHHLDDSLETFLINLSRGTGLEGLLGIQDNQNIIRPLIDFSREQIEEYARENGLRWREDTSNLSDKYLRNKIRHQIVPLIKELNSDFMGSFLKTINHLQGVQLYINESVPEVLDKMLIKKNNYSSLKTADLKKHKSYTLILYKWLLPFGFTAWNDIYNLVDAQSGKFIESEDFRILKNRDELILSKIDRETPKAVLIQKEQKEINYPIKLRFSMKRKFTSDVWNKNVAYVDKNLLKFPLVLGKWKKGDYFYPFGMQGKKKKISKFFKDEKLSVLDKENTWILYSGNQVVWIVGMRIDDRFKKTDDTTSMTKIEYLK